MTFPLDQPVTLTFRTYSDSARTTLADATTAVLYLKAPDGTVSTPTVTHSSTGIYTYLAPDTTAGLYQYRWKATGTVTTSSPTGAFFVWAAFPPAIVGLDDVKTGTNITATTDDDELQNFIYTASAMLLNHPAYRIADVCQATTYTEWHDPADTLILAHYPVAAVTSITEYTGTTAQVIAAEPFDGASFTSNGWAYDDGAGANGILLRLSGGTPVCWRGNRVKVVYTAGTGSVPADVRGAVLDLIAHLWETQRGGSGPGLAPGLEAESNAGTFGDVFGPAFALPNRVKEQLEAYRKIPAVA